MPNKKNSTHLIPNIQIINMKAAFFCLVSAITLFATASARPSYSGAVDERELVNVNHANFRRGLVVSPLKEGEIKYSDIPEGGVSPVTTPTYDPITGKFVYT